MKRSKLKVVESTHAWGFDLTDISPDAWIRVLKLALAPSEPQNVDGIWHWYGIDGLVIRTGNNPITGEFSRAGQRANEIGYASHIGIEGSDAALVQRIALEIREHASYIKDETSGMARFI